MSRIHRSFWWLIVLVSIANRAEAGDPPSFPGVQFGSVRIDYWGKSDDAVQRLQRRMEADEVRLQTDPRFGLLPAVLMALQIDPSSQVLKFRSGSPHREIGSEKPRAIYFRDDVAVAWHPGSPQVEIAAQDSRRGTIFYTLTHNEEGPPRFERPGRCVSCHTGPNTGTNVPGWQLHSGVELRDTPALSWRNFTSPSLPFTKRWQTLYVRGVDPLASARELTEDLPFVKNGDYPQVIGDPAAVLVRDHWLLGMNLLTRWSYEHQLQQPREGTTTVLARYILMLDEAPLPRPLPNDTLFVRWWQAQGPRDSDGRSLRELDLQTRTFRYAVSPLILTAMMQEQPLKLRQELYRQIDRELRSNETLPHRNDTLAILRTTVPDWNGE